jgi:hypothetical protein
MSANPDPSVSLCVAVAPRGNDPVARSEASPRPASLLLRRAQPALVLLPRTVSWIDNLPPAARPKRMAEHFARIANLLCVLWNEPTTCRAYLADLLLDRRGGRAGFPPVVLDEIAKLHAFYEYSHRPLGHVLEWDTSGLDLAWTGSSQATWDWVA